MMSEVGFVFIYTYIVPVEVCFLVDIKFMFLCFTLLSKKCKMWIK